MAIKLAEATIVTDVTKDELYLIKGRNRLAKVYNVTANSEKGGSITSDVVKEYSPDGFLINGQPFSGLGVPLSKYTAENGYGYTDSAKENDGLTGATDLWNFIDKSEPRFIASNIDDSKTLEQLQTELDNDKNSYKCYVVFRRKEKPIIEVKIEDIDVEFTDSLNYNGVTLRGHAVPYVNGVSDDNLQYQVLANRTKLSDLKEENWLTFNSESTPDFVRQMIGTEEREISISSGGSYGNNNLRGFGCFSYGTEKDYGVFENVRFIKFTKYGADIRTGNARLGDWGINYLYGPAGEPNFYILNPPYDSRYVFNRTKFTNTPKDTTNTNLPYIYFKGDKYRAFLGYIAPSSSNSYFKGWSEQNTNSLGICGIYGSQGTRDFAEYRCLYTPENVRGYGFPTKNQNNSYNQSDIRANNVYHVWYDILGFTNKRVKMNLITRIGNNNISYSNVTLDGISLGTNWSVSKSGDKITITEDYAEFTQTYASGLKVVYKGLKGFSGRFNAVNELYETAPEYPNHSFTTTNNGYERSYRVSYDTYTLKTNFIQNLSQVKQTSNIISVIGVPPGHGDTANVKITLDTGSNKPKPSELTIYPANAATYDSSTGIITTTGDYSGTITLSNFKFTNNKYFVRQSFIIYNVFEDTTYPLSVEEDSPELIYLDPFDDGYYIINSGISNISNVSVSYLKYNSDGYPRFTTLTNVDPDATAIPITSSYIKATFTWSRDGKEYSIYLNDKHKDFRYINITTDSNYIILQDGKATYLQLPDVVQSLTLAEPYASYDTSTGIIKLDVLHSGFNTFSGALHITSVITKPFNDNLYSFYGTLEYQNESGLFFNVETSINSDEIIVGSMMMTNAFTKVQTDGIVTELITAGTTQEDEHQYTAYINKCGLPISGTVYSIERDENNTLSYRQVSFNAPYGYDIYTDEYKTIEQIRIEYVINGGTTRYSYGANEINSTATITITDSVYGKINGSADKVFTKGLTANESKNYFTVSSIEPPVGYSYDYQVGTISYSNSYEITDLNMSLNTGITYRKINFDNVVYQNGIIANNSNAPISCNIKYNYKDANGYLCYKEENNVVINHGSSHVLTGVILRYSIDVSNGQGTSKSITSSLLPQKYATVTFSGVGIQKFGSYYAIDGSYTFSVSLSTNKSSLNVKNFTLASGYAYQGKTGTVTWNRNVTITDFTYYEYVPTNVITYKIVRAEHFISVSGDSDLSYYSYDNDCGLPISGTAEYTFEADGKIYYKTKTFTNVAQGDAILSEYSDDDFGMSTDKVSNVRVYITYYRTDVTEVSKNVNFNNFTRAFSITFDDELFGQVNGSSNRKISYNIANYSGGQFAVTSIKAPNGYSYNASIGTVSVTKYFNITSTDMTVTLGYEYKLVDLSKVTFNAATKGLTNNSNLLISYTFTWNTKDSNNNLLYKTITGTLGNGNSVTLTPDSLLRYKIDISNALTQTTSISSTDAPLSQAKVTIFGQGIAKVNGINTTNNQVAIPVNLSSSATTYTISSITYADGYASRNGDTGTITFSNVIKIVDFNYYDGSTYGGVPIQASINLETIYDEHEPTKYYYNNNSGLPISGTVEIIQQNSSNGKYTYRTESFTNVKQDWPVFSYQDDDTELPQEVKITYTLSGQTTKHTYGSLDSTFKINVANASVLNGNIAADSNGQFPIDLKDYPSGIFTVAKIKPAAGYAYAGTTDEVSLTTSKNVTITTREANTTSFAFDKIYMDANHIAVNSDFGIAATTTFTNNTNVDCIYEIKMNYYNNNGIVHYGSWREIVAKGETITLNNVRGISYEITLICASDKNINATKSLGQVTSIVVVTLEGIGLDTSKTKATTTNVDKAGNIFLVYLSSQKTPSLEGVFVAQNGYAIDGVEAGSKNFSVTLDSMNKTYSTGIVKVDYDNWSYENGKITNKTGVNLSYEAKYVYNNNGLVLASTSGAVNNGSTVTAVSSFSSRLGTQLTYDFNGSHGGSKTTGTYQETATYTLTDRSLSEINGVATANNKVTGTVQLSSSPASFKIESIKPNRGFQYNHSIGTSSYTYTYTIDAYTKSWTSTIASLIDLTNVTVQVTGKTIKVINNTGVQITASFECNFINIDGRIDYTSAGLGNISHGQSTSYSITNGTSIGAYKVNYSVTDDATQTSNKNEGNIVDCVYVDITDLNDLQTDTGANITGVRYNGITYTRDGDWIANIKVPLNQTFSLYAATVLCDGYVVYAKADDFDLTGDTSFTIMQLIDGVVQINDNNVGLTVGDSNFTFTGNTTTNVSYTIDYTYFDNGVVKTGTQLTGTIASKGGYSNTTTVTVNALGTISTYDIKIKNGTKITKTFSSTKVAPQMNVSESISSNAVSIRNTGNLAYNYSYEIVYRSDSCYYTSGNGSALPGVTSSLFSGAAVLLYKITITNSQGLASAKTIIDNNNFKFPVSIYDGTDISLSYIQPGGYDQRDNIYLLNPSVAHNSSNKIYVDIYAIANDDRIIIDDDMPYTLYPNYNGSYDLDDVISYHIPESPIRPVTEEVTLVMDNFYYEEGSPCSIGLHPESDADYDYYTYYITCKNRNDSGVIVLTRTYDYENRQLIFNASDIGSDYIITGVVLEYGYEHTGNDGNFYYSMGRTAPWDSTELYESFINNIQSYGVEVEFYSRPCASFSYDTETNQVTMIVDCVYHGNEQFALSQPIVYDNGGSEFYMEQQNEYSYSTSEIELGQSYSCNIYYSTDITFALIPEQGEALEPLETSYDIYFEIA